MQYDGLDRLSKQTGVIFSNVLLQTLRFRNRKVVGSPYQNGRPLHRDAHLVTLFERRTFASGFLSPRHSSFLRLRMEERPLDSDGSYEYIK
jgi:hypothetical protein